MKLLPCKMQKPSIHHVKWPSEETNKQTNQPEERKKWNAMKFITIAFALSKHTKQIAHRQCVIQTLTFTLIWWCTTAIALIYMDLRLTRRVIPLLQYMYDVPCTTLNIYLHWDGSHQMELRHELFIETETNWKIITNLSQTNDFHIRNTVEHGLLFDYCSVALRALVGI